MNNASTEIVRELKIKNLKEQKRKVSFVLVPSDMYVYLV